MRELAIDFAPVDLPAAGDVLYNDQPTLTPVWTTVPVSGWLEAGHPLQEGDTLLVTAMLHNTTGRDLQGVQL